MLLPCLLLLLPSVLLRCPGTVTLLLRRHRRGRGLPQRDPWCGVLTRHGLQVVSEKMRNGGYWQIRAVDATASVLWAFCRHWGHPLAAIVGAMHQGETWACGLAGQASW